jgi:arylsulfatase A-like enzyme
VRTRIPPTQWNKGLRVSAAERQKITADGAGRGKVGNDLAPAGGRAVLTQTLSPWAKLVRSSGAGFGGNLHHFIALSSTLRRLQSCHVESKIMKAEPSAPSSIGSFLIIGLWFGIVTGLIEAAGLLLFQRINWARWGAIMHVSREILWVSPIVDLILFLALAIAVFVVSRFFKRIPAFRVLIFLLVFLSAYNFLTVPDRLYHIASLLLGLGIAVSVTRWIGEREAASLRFWKRSTPWAVALLLVVFAGIQGGKYLHEKRMVAKLPAAAAGSPNVLVIVVDTLRADHVSSYGYARPTTPEIDVLAKQGTLFENAISTCSWSLPSHVSLLTGRHVFEHGVGNVEPMPLFGQNGSNFRGFPTLGEELERSGYRTGAFSANRVYFSHSLGFGRGFIHFEDYFNSASDAFVRTLFGREFARIYLARSDKSLVRRTLRGLGFTAILDRDTEGWGSHGGARSVRKRASAVNEETLRWIDSDSDRQRPFFAFLNYIDVHNPYGPPATSPKPAWDTGSSVDQYDAGVNYADDNIGQLMRELEKRGLANNTLVIITSDHGESLGDHGLTYHGAALYWELIHVPLIVWYPGHVPAGLRITQPVTNAAIPAAVMDLLGSNRQTFPGPPLSAFWKTREVTKNWPDPLSELPQTEIITREDRVVEGKIPIATNGGMKSLVTPGWHLIVHQKLGEQLYDWEHDPGESTNRAADSANRSIGVRLAEEMSARTKPQH